MVKLSRALRLCMLVSGSLLATQGQINGASAAASSGDRGVAPQIVGGNQAPDLPFLARLNVTAASTGQRDAFACGGTLVAPDVVLTAAHCTLDPDGSPLDKIVVFAGGDLTAVDAALAAGKSATQLGATAVETVVRHPQFSFDGRAYDAALLLLERPLTATPVRLAGPDDAALSATGTEQTTVGYGYTDGSAPSSVHVPRSTQLGVLADVACSARSAEFDADTMLCAEHAPRGTCFGDSGGPLLVRQAGGAWVQTGVTSWIMSGCGQAPSVFARTAAAPINSWLQYELALRAGTGSLPGAPLHLQTTATGGLQALSGATPVFRPRDEDTPNSPGAGLIVQSQTGTLQNYGPAFAGRWSIDREWVPVSQGEVTGTGTTASPYTRVDVFRSPGDAPLRLSVSQTITYVTGRTGFKVRYAITNTGTAPARFAAAAVGEPHTIGPGIDDEFVIGGQSRRFLGVGSPTRASATGLVEVPGAAPWSSFFAGSADDLSGQLAEHAALSDEVRTFPFNQSVAVRWADRAGADAALPPGATATYATEWLTRAASPLVIAPADGPDVLGGSATITVASQDPAGGPRPGTKIAWRVGADDAPVQHGTADARGVLTFSALRPATGIVRVTAWEDTDGDSVADGSEAIATTTVHFTDQPSDATRAVVSGLPQLEIFGPKSGPPVLIVSAADIAAAPGRCVPVAVRIPASAVPGAVFVGGNLTMKSDRATPQEVVLDPETENGPSGSVCADGGQLSATLYVPGQEERVQLPLADIAVVPGIGRVVQDGQPLTGARVQLEQLVDDAWTTPGGLAVRPAAATLTTIAGGAYGWQLVPDSTYRVTASSGGATRTSAPFLGSAPLPTIDLTPQPPLATTPPEATTPPTPPAATTPPAGPRVTPPNVLLNENTKLPGLGGAEPTGRPSALRVTINKRGSELTVRVQCKTKTVCRSAQKVTIVVLGRTLKLKVPAWKTRSTALKLKVRLGARQRAAIRTEPTFQVLVRAKALGRSGAEDRLTVHTG